MGPTLSRPSCATLCDRFLERGPRTEGDGRRTGEKAAISRGRDRMDRGFARPWAQEVPGQNPGAPTKSTAPATTTGSVPWTYASRGAFDLKVRPLAVDGRRSRSNYRTPNSHLSPSASEPCCRPRRILAAWARRSPRRLCDQCATSSREHGDRENRGWPCASQTRGLTAAPSAARRESARPTPRSIAPPACLSRSRARNRSAKTDLCGMLWKGTPNSLPVAPFMPGLRGGIPTIPSSVSEPGPRHAAELGGQPGRPDDHRRRGALPRPGRRPRRCPFTKSRRPAVPILGECGARSSSCEPRRGGESRPFATWYRRGELHLMVTGDTRGGLSRRSMWPGGRSLGSARYWVATVLLHSMRSYGAAEPASAHGQRELRDRPKAHREAHHESR